MLKIPDAPGDLDAGEDVDRLSVRAEPYAPREERQGIAPDAAETEDAGVLQEEVAFLREEERKAREVDLPIVDFGLGEVGIDGQGRGEGRRDLVEDVQASARSSRRCDYEPDPACIEAKTRA